MLIFSYGNGGQGRARGGQACASTYFEFTHHYTCSQNEAKTATEWGITLSAAEKKVISELGGNLNPSDPKFKFCLFTPKVQVLDNWGWCGGVDASGKATGYWNDEINQFGIPTNNCDPMKTSSWTPFKGKIIIVVPSG